MSIVPDDSKRMKLVTSFERNTMSNVREKTSKLIELVEEGHLTWEMIARASLCYLSEADVADMADHNELISEDI